MWLFLKILAAVAVYGTAIEPRFVVRDDEPAPIPALPAAWEGKQIAVFADLQVGMWWANTDAARRLVRKVVEIHPGAVDRGRAARATPPSCKREAPRLPALRSDAPQPSSRIMRDASAAARAGSLLSLLRMQPRRTQSRSRHSLAALASAG